MKERGLILVNSSVFEVIKGELVLASNGNRRANGGCGGLELLGSISTNVFFAVVRLNEMLVEAFDECLC